MSNFNKKTILLTGGAGYIGTQICHELIALGKVNVVVIDNLVNSSWEGIKAINSEQIICHQLDLRDYNSLAKIMSSYQFDAVIHLAGLKSVKKSFSDPIEYYDNNLVATLNLMKCLDKVNLDRSKESKESVKFIFSSSATVYGEPTGVPIDEEMRVSPINPYGRTKLMIEEMLKDRVAVPNDEEHKCWQVISLRYFNPIGADPSGLIGENPNGIPENLVPYVLKVIAQEKGFECLKIFGDDYPTPDGTAIRDYLHVVDLAKAHVMALEKMLNGNDENYYQVYNLGTGKGSSVIDVVKNFEKLGCRVPYQIMGRREGDSAMIWADPSKAQRELGWKAEYGIEEMCRDAWLWWSKKRG